MGKAVRSARGAAVDFDLLKIKEQLAAQPAPVSVADRREYIDVRDGVSKTRRTIAASEVNLAEPVLLAPQEISISVQPARSKKETKNDEA